VNIAPEFKNAQRTGNQPFVAIGQKGMFTMDPRTGENEIAVQEKLYKTDPKFNTVATSLAGGLVIGSLNGEIRLYKQVGQNAKTLLPGLGDAIIGLDVTLDGRWVLATCDTYLLLIPTSCKGDKTGFEVPMGKEKPKPIKLSLRPQDMSKYGITQVQFTPAKFNNGEKANERVIVVGTGDWVVVWDFKRVIRGHLNDYKLKRLGENIVSNEFKFNNDEDLLITTMQQLQIQRTKKKEVPKH